MDIVPQDCSKYHATPEVKEAADRIGVLMAKERAVTVACRFEAGDIFNTLWFDSGPRAEYIMERFGEAEYKWIRHCAWVAYKWPKNDRVAGKPWRYFRDSIPIVLKKKAPSNTFHLVKTEVDGDEVRMTGIHGRKTITITASKAEAGRMAGYILHIDPFGQD